MIFTVEMTARGVFILVFISFVSVIEGFDSQVKFPTGTPTIEECMNPPMKKFGHECCRLPKARIWGDLRGSLRMCLKKYKEAAKQEPQLMRQEEGEGEPETPIPADAPTQAPTESSFTPTSSPPSSTPGLPNRRRRPHWKKPLSERVKDYFATLYKEIKNTVDALWQSVVMITDHLRQYPNDSCFMECVFEDQGFLVSKMVNKEALLTRLSLTLGRNEAWHLAAVGAVETCYVGLQVPANGTCQSGSEEIFRCIFKQLFFNCPDWAQNDYCTSLKEFYKKCPNGPPPETPETDTHTTALPEEDSSGAITTESEPEQ